MRDTTTAGSTTTTTARFPTIEDKPSVLLSLIVPAFDEEKRLPIMLEETIAYLKQR